MRLFPPTFTKGTVIFSSRDWKELWKSTLRGASVSTKNLADSLSTVFHPRTYGLLTYRAHVTDSSLGRKTINRWIRLCLGSITPRARLPSPRTEWTCTHLNVCASRERVGLHVWDWTCKAWFEGFGKALHVRVFVHVSVCSNFSPKGPEVTAVRKQIDFSPPTHKQLTTCAQLDAPCMILCLDLVALFSKPTYSSSLCLHASEDWSDKSWWDKAGKSFVCPGFAKLALPSFHLCSILGLCVPLWDELRLSIMMSPACRLVINIIHSQLPTWTTSWVSKAKVQIWM